MSRKKLTLVMMAFGFVAAFVLTLLIGIVAEPGIWELLVFIICMAGPVVWVVITDSWELVDNYWDKFSSLFKF